MVLIQLDWQTVNAENGGDFAAMMNFMFEHMPDDPLEQNCGSDILVEMVNDLRLGSYIRSELSLGTK